MGNANAGGGSQYPTTTNAPTMNNTGAPASMTSSWDSYFNQSNVSSMGQMTGNQASMGQQHQGGMNPNQNANAAAMYAQLQQQQQQLQQQQQMYMMMAKQNSGQGNALGMNMAQAYGNPSMAGMNVNQNAMMGMQPSAAYGNNPANAMGMMQRSSQDYDPYMVANTANNGGNVNGHPSSMMYGSHPSGTGNEPSRWCGGVGVCNTSFSLLY
jgi:hypothetical protein